jgi:hypothetical protein
VTVAIAFVRVVELLGCGVERWWTTAIAVIEYDEGPFWKVDIFVLLEEFVGFRGADLGLHQGPGKKRRSDICYER